MNSLSIARSDKAKRDYAPRRRFTPSGLPTLAAMVLVTLFIAAGHWQWEKAAAKEALQVRLDAGRANEALTMSATRVDAQALAFRRVSARGSFEAQGEILIDNRVHDGQPGYHVLTPLRLAGSDTRVLVNRGWVPAAADRRALPQLDRPLGVVEISGVAVIPPTRFFTLGADDAASAGSLWQHLDLARYAKEAAYPLQPVVIELDAQSEGGFVREWRRPDERMFTNRGYALQWWAFAATTVVLWLALSFRRLLEKTQ